tara:strand:- start:102 stop:317 length:216 start_codon:yes stop_codon:yes gene_type:complete
MKKDVCRHCHNFGYARVYVTTVRRVYCDCEAGAATIEKAKETLREVGLNPDDRQYQWLTRKDILDKINKGE